MPELIQTIHLYDDGTYTVESPPPPPIVAEPPARQLVEVTNEWDYGRGLFGMAGLVENYQFNCHPKTFGVFLAGSGNTVRDVRVDGGENGILIRDAQNATVEKYYCRNATYGIFLDSAGGGGNRGVNLSGLDIDASAGQHGLRLYAAQDVFIRDSIIAHSGGYKGACLNIRQGVNVNIIGVKTRGHSNGFGPDYSNPRESAFTLDGLVIDGCDFLLDWTMQFYPKCNGFLVKNTKIHMTDPTLECVGVHGGASGVLENCTLTGGKTPGNATFVNCTWNGAVIV